MLKSAGVQDTVKLLVLPREKDILMFRLENLADLDSGVGEASVDLEKIARAYWDAVNTSEPSITIVETTINGNMPIEEMRSRRLQWKADGIKQTETTKDDSNDMVSLKPMQLRTFTVSYKSQEALFMQ